MSDNARAGAIMVLAACLLSLNDAIAKHVGASLGVAQVLFFRGVFATLLLAAAALLTRHALFDRAMLDRWVLARGGLEIAGTLCFIAGLTMLPIAVATTLGFTAPLLVTVMAATVLRERVGWRRWAAVVAGFAGAALVTGAGTKSWDPAFFLPLGAAFMVAARDLVTRRVSGEVPSIHVALVTSAMVTSAGLLGTPLAAAPVGAADLAWLALGALFLCASYYGWITAVRLGELSFVAPLVYTGILVALLLGVVVWGDVVTPRQLSGIALVVGAGVFTFARERGAARAA